MLNHKYVRTLLVGGILCLLMISCKEKKDSRVVIQQKLTPLHKLKEQPMPGEWLAEHKETYQSFETYVNKKPTRLDGGRDKIYVMRIGTFSPAELQIVSKAARYLWLFYGLQVKYVSVPENANFLKDSREREDTGVQLSASLILNDVLAPVLPGDAAVLIAFTTYDLYPRPDWNYVFGLASLKKRVGVWSINRFGCADNPKEFDQVFQRTIRTATHEIGHMFSIRHCVKYECCMNGSNNKYEMDGRPTYFCPECLRKLCWNLKQDEKQHLTRVRSFWINEKNYELIGFYDRSIKAISED
ncbi:archaemetzincin [Cytophagaceae bacterium YF14B1]|uniref:Archaemetzincin n=1 Tax=Xanthocytophaga flava TaxID=3048013 RepID=A0AAE3QYD9_9BACT|nr:archaemetzincin [Xanthocytophaga flavus]MDJ1485455.1 archaemetzincin [Xanthocytophaga flavus]